MPYIPLHVHSHYSLLNGLPQIGPLVAEAKKRGFASLALTDYGSLYGAIEFYETCQELGIKPIIGLEAFVAPRRRHEKDIGETEAVHNLILLAENYEGYRNLMQLSSRGHLEGFFRGQPRIDRALLREHNAGIIALSGPMTGEISALLKKGEPEKAANAAREYAEIFGPEHFYLELQDHPAIAGQMAVNAGLIELGRKLKLPLVVTRDTHYLEPEDAEAADIVRCIAEGWKVDEPNREDLRQVDRSLGTAEDISSRFRHIPEAIENTGRIADRVQLQIPLNQWHFATVELPPGKTADQALSEAAHSGLTKYFPEATTEMDPDPVGGLPDLARIRDRLEYELQTIQKKGYSPYFLSVADYVAYAKSHGIIETTRGSAAGSLVSYVLGITTVDPIKFQLPFERFLNPYRPSPPDIDTDFADDRRDEMISYVTEKYGVGKVAQIITFGTMAARASVRDVGRALGFSYTFCDQVAKLIPLGAQGFPMTIARALKEEPDLRKLYETNADVKRLLTLAQKVEGNARHTSIHAAGVVISPTALTDFTPVQRETGGEKIITQYEMHAVEAAGLLKMDFLGIRNLSILGKAVEFVEKTTGEKIDVYNLPLDDAGTFAMLARGETMGTFQLGGLGMTRWLKELKPTTVNDIMAMVALYRPGPMDVIPEYIRRKHHPELVEYLDERMKKYLGASFGLLVYQDDVLLTAIHLAGYDWVEADKFRKAIGKKIPAEMEKQKIKFAQGCRTHGRLSDEQIEELWRRIEPFAAYGFNKCLVADTEVVDYATGAVKTIKEMYQRKETVSVLSLAANKKLTSKKITRVYNNGQRPVWEVITRSGRKITATGSHPFFRYDGWRKLAELRVSDLVAVPRKIEYQPSADLGYDAIKVLGYLLAEGNLCHPHGLYFYSAEEAEVRNFVKAVRCFPNSKVTIDRSKRTAAVYVGQINPKIGNSLRRWLAGMGLCARTATEKFIPDVVFRLHKDKVAGLIGAMWQGDGCIHDGEHGQIYYATSAERLARQMQHLLLRLNIVSTIHKKKFAYRNGKKIGYTVNISRYNNIANFARAVGRHLLPGKKAVLNSLVEKNKVLNGAIPMGAARGSKDIVPAAILSLIKRELKQRGISIKKISRELGMAERIFCHDRQRKGFLRETVEKIGVYLHSGEILSAARSDVYWDEVVSIKSRGLADTYDLTVPGEHNFVANDIFVHNSHAASYGIVAYQTAYMKAHYPVQYMTAVLQAEAGDADKVAAIVHECKRMGIEVLPPDINESFRNFAMVSRSGESGRIRFGLTAIKNVGEHICEVIYRERKERGPYQNLENFLERVQDKDLNKKSLESLIQAGAMDSFGHDRGGLLFNIENLLSFSRETRTRGETGQHSLFSGTAIALDKKVTLKPAPAAATEQKLEWEKSLLGLYLSAHPLEPFVSVFQSVATPLSEVEGATRDSWVVALGVVDTFKKKITKKGEVMLFATIQDQTGSLELLVFPRAYEKTGALWRERGLVCVVGKTSREEGDNKLFLENAYSLTVETAPGLAAQLALGRAATEAPVNGTETADKTATSAVNPPRGSSGDGALAGAGKTTPSGSTEKHITLALTPEDIKKHAAALQALFARYPGDCAVFVRVGERVIRASGRVDWCPSLQSELAGMVGREPVQFSRS